MSGARAAPEGAIMERTARQQVDAWQRDTQGSVWCGYDETDDAEFEDDDDAFPRRVVRPRRRPKPRRVRRGRPRD
jgi:hypothetical protein